MNWFNTRKRIEKLEAELRNLKSDRSSVDLEAFDKARFIGNTGGYSPFGCSPYPYTQLAEIDWTGPEINRRFVELYNFLGLEHQTTPSVTKLCKKAKP